MSVPSPSTLDLPTVLGTLGVALLLGVFFLNLSGRLRTDSLAYLIPNLVGASLACWSSWAIDFLPFVILEGTWAVVAALALVRRLRPTPGRRP